MTRTSNTKWRVLLPLLISVALSASAFHFMTGRLIKGGNLKLEDKCPKPYAGTHYQRKFLGGYIPPIEQLVCILVSFFEPVFQPEASHHAPFFRDFLISFVAPVTVPLFEASRANRSLLLAFPLVAGLLYQICGGGVILPLYWGIFLATMDRRALSTQIDQGSAEAVLFGLFMGFGLPTFTMLYYSSIEAIAIWQGFPLWVSIFQHIHLFFRPPGVHGRSGYRTVQATYILIFMISTTFHVRTLSAYNFDLQIAGDAFFPTLAEPTAKGSAAPLASTLHFLQWDMVFIFGSTLLASLWFAESIFQGILLVTWITISSIALGPGAAVAGIFIWREKRLKYKRGKQVPAIKVSKKQ